MKKWMAILLLGVMMACAACGKTEDKQQADNSAQINDKNDETEQQDENNDSAEEDGGEVKEDEETKSEEEDGESEEGTSSENAESGNEQSEGKDETGTDSKNDSNKNSSGSTNSSSNNSSNNSNKNNSDKKEDKNNTSDKKDNNKNDKNNENKNEDKEANDDSKDKADSAAAVLTAVWDSYAEEDKFAAAGGDYDSNVDGAPGKFDLSKSEEMEYLLCFPADCAEYIDDAASLVHMMNANTFTAGSYHVKKKSDVNTVVEGIKARTLNNQWMCGFPDKLVIVNVGDGYVVSAFGKEAFIETFKSHIKENYQNAKIVVEENLE